MPEQYIQKIVYEGLYCVGCESFKTEKELVNGLCPEHQKEPQYVKEKNYFFKLSKYQNKLLELIESNELKITPQNKRAETIAFIKGGLEDFSISRSKERAQGVGVPVPNDPDQVIYVWFDALNIYMTGVGFGWDEELWKKWWPADLHIIGKDINRFHTVYWPAMLLSANLPLPKEILIHGFVNVGGLKISKSIGNVIDPKDVAEEFGLEAVRYFLLSQIPINGDGDFTNERFKEVYNADLANGLGNLVARVSTMAENSQVEFKGESKIIEPDIDIVLAEYKFDEALRFIWGKIRELDVLINEKKVWELKGEELEKVLEFLVSDIRQIAVNLKPFLPATAEKIEKQFNGSKIKKGKPLFPRLK